MDNVTLIAAVGKNNELGKDNKLIWRFKEDLMFFKAQTINKTIVMGINTFLSLGRLLPDRKHIVLTHQEIMGYPDVMVFHDLNKLLEYMASHNEEFMIIGGASIYRQFLEYAKKMYLTTIEETFKGADAYFPQFKKDEWDVSCLGEYEENNIRYKHLVYIRKK